MYYFLHIPKTAGTSLTNILENNFEYDKIMKHVIFPEFFKNYENDLDKFELIRGHFGCWINKFLEKKPITITMLREPTEQTLSLYAHQLKIFGNDEYCILKHANESLSEIFDDPRRRMMFSNHQIRHLALDIDEDVVNLIKQHKWKKKIIKTHRPKLSTNNQSDLLKIAKSRLKEFEFIGITEKFEESMILLYYTFRWYPIIKIPKLNISKNRKKEDELDDETLTKLSVLTRFDKKLYQYGLEIFKKRFEQMEEDLEKKYLDDSSKNMNKNDRILQMLKMHHFKDKFDSKIPFTKFVDYEFFQPMIGWGWYERERNINGKIFRWMGPEPIAEIYFPLDLSDNLEIQLKVIKSVSNQICDSLQLIANDCNIDLEIINKKRKLLSSDEITFKGIIPKNKNFSRKDYSCLQFIVDKTISPKSENPLSKDMRKLGVAFSEIKIKPE